MKAAFKPASEYENRSSGGYTVLPFRYRRLRDSRILLSNDGGEYILLEPDEFNAFHRKELPQDSPIYRQLERNNFLAGDDVALPILLQARALRSRRALIGTAPYLHIVVVTLRCEHTCVYCQVSRVSEDRESFDLSAANAEHICRLILESPADPLKVEFQGGEPLLAFERIQQITERLGALSRTASRRIEFVVATNLATAQLSQLEYLRDFGARISTSLDGSAGLHDHNRHRMEASSHASAIAGIERARAVLGTDQIAALLTVTRESIRDPSGIVDEYVKHGFHELFLRPMSPYGFAAKAQLKYGYPTEAFLAFYKAALDRVIEVNRAGYSLIEAQSQMLLQRLLSFRPSGYVDMQSPAGAAGTCLVYNYDGFVYPSDEARMLAEMGDKSLRLGHVTIATRRSIQLSDLAERLRNTSILEAMPGCCDCAYLPYCGCDPVLARRETGSIVGHRPTSDFCARQIGMLDHLVDRLETGDSFESALLRSWAFRC